MVRRLTRMLLAGTDSRRLHFHNTVLKLDCYGLDDWCANSSLLRSNLFAGTGRGVFRSSNNGTNWAAVNAGLADTNVRALVVSPNGEVANLFAGTDEASFYPLTMEQAGLHPVSG